MANQYEFFIMVDYDDKISFDYWHRNYGNNENMSVFIKRMLELKELFEVEELLKTFHKRYSEKRQRILKKSDSYAIDDAFKVGNWTLNDYHVYMFRNGKWYQLLYQNGGSNVFKIVEP